MSVLNPGCYCQVFLAISVKSLKLIFRSLQLLSCTTVQEFPEEKACMPESCVTYLRNLSVWMKLTTVYAISITLLLYSNLHLQADH